MSTRIYFYINIRKFKAKGNINKIIIIIINTLIQNTKIKKH